MASTSYNTLTLSEEEPRKARSSAIYVVLGLAVVAMAGAAAVFVSSAAHAQSVVNAEFSAAAGSVTNCDPESNGYLQALPKYDPTLSNNRDDFYNACYYAFRCCTTKTKNCAVSENFGQSCQACLGSRAPRMVKPWCMDYMNKDFGTDADALAIAKTETDTAATYDLTNLEASTFTTDGALRVEVLPAPKTESLILALSLFPEYKDANGDLYKTCWPQAGPNDGRVATFVSECFDVISWCNLLCPRDQGNSNGHAMCKQCMVTDFGVDTLDATNGRIATGVVTAETAEIAVSKAVKEVGDAKAAWDDVYGANRPTTE